MAARRRVRRVTLVNQFFPPDLAPTAHLTAALAGHLADRGWEVTVITAGDGYVDRSTDGDGSATDGTRVHADVRVLRPWIPALGKASIVKRLTDYVTFLAGSWWRLLRLPRQDVVISLTTPPFVVVGAVAHKLLRRRTRVVLWSMDCYPDVIERLGSRTGGDGAVPATTGGRRTVPSIRSAVRPLVSLRRGGPMSRVLRSINRWVFRHLDHVVALDEAMRDLLLDGYGTADGGPPTTVIPNWESLADFPPTDASTISPWPTYERDDLAGRFVVLYLGNLGYGHRIETVVDAAASLDPDEDVAWLFVGGGARWDELGRLADEAVSSPAIVRHPYVAKELTPAVMAGAGCALIVLADEALGVMSPSKLHANLAAGLPILYVGPAGSNVDEAIERFDCGVSIRSGDAGGLVAALRRLQADPDWRDELAANARRAFEEAYSDRVTLARWDTVLTATTSVDLPDR